MVGGGHPQVGFICNKHVVITLLGKNLMPLADALRLLLAVVLIAAVWVHDPEHRRRRGVVMSEYRGWSIQISASCDRERRWHAEVRVWPGREERIPAGAAKVDLPGGWDGHADVVMAALELARQYIDLSA